MKSWQCIVCGFIYDEAKGLPEDGIAPGTYNLTDSYNLTGAYDIIDSAAQGVIQTDQYNKFRHLYKNVNSNNTLKNEELYRNISYSHQLNNGYNMNNMNSMNSMNQFPTTISTQMPPNMQNTAGNQMNNPLMNPVFMQQMMQMKKIIIKDLEK